MIFFLKKSCKKVWRLKNLLYLCTRNQEGTTLLKATGSGALVQLVRIRACHARGQGFESPTHRTKEDNRKVVFFFLFLPKSEGKMDHLQKGSPAKVGGEAKKVRQK